VLSVKDGRKQNKEHCNQAVNKTVTTLTIGEHVSVWTQNVYCANISLPGRIRFHYVVTAIVSQAKAAVGLKVKKNFTSKFRRS